MSDGFSIYSLDHPEISRTARAHIIERRKELEEQLVNGMVSSWEDYRQRVGHLQGLTDALQIIDELAKEKDERGSKNARKSATDR